MTAATMMRFTAVPLGLLSTLALLFLMAVLIQTDYVYTEPETSLKIGKIVMPETEIVNQYKLPLTRPDTPPMPPATPIIKDDIVIETTAPGGFVFQVPSATDTHINLDTLQAGDYLPRLKVAPQYPRAALHRGLEGEVVVSFTVTPEGNTRDVVVLQATTLEGTPTSIFNRSAIKAAEGFKYKPRVKNGTPIEVRGVQNRFVFELAK